MFCTYIKMMLPTIHLYPQSRSNDIYHLDVSNWLMLTHFVLIIMHQNLATIVQKLCYGKVSSRVMFPCKLGTPYASS